MGIVLCVSKDINIDADIIGRKVNIFKERRLRGLVDSLKEFEKVGFRYIHEFYEPPKIDIPTYKFLGRIIIERINESEIKRRLSGKLEFGNKKQIKALQALEYLNLVREISSLRREVRGY